MKILVIAWVCLALHRGLVENEGEYRLLLIC